MVLKNTLFFFICDKKHNRNLEHNEITNYSRRLKTFKTKKQKQKLIEKGNRNPILQLRNTIFPTQV